MSEQDQPVDMKKAAIAWVAGQPFNNVLLILILGSGLWACHYALTVAVPAHLKQIQEGYERIEESNSRDRNMIIQQYDKWFNAIQKRDDGHNTGGISPTQIFEQVWSSGNEHSGIFGQQIAIQGFGQGFQIPEEIAIETAGGNKLVLVRSTGSTESWRYVPWVGPGRNRRSIGTDGPAFDAAERAVRRIGTVPGSLIERARNEQ